MNIEQVRNLPLFTVLAYADKSQFPLRFILSQNINPGDFEILYENDYIEVITNNSRDQELVHSIFRNLYGPVVRIYMGPSAFQS